MFQQARIVKDGTLIWALELVPEETADNMQPVLTDNAQHYGPNRQADSGGGPAHQWTKTGGHLHVHDLIRQRHFDRWPLQTHRAAGHE